MGDLISNILGCSSLSEIISALESIYGDSFKVDLTQSRERWLDDDGNYGPPLIANVGETFKVVSDIFTVRHILVHETGWTKPYDQRQISIFLQHSHQFTEALSWLATYRLYGAVPRHRYYWTEVARERAAASHQELLDQMPDKAPVSECLEDHDPNLVWIRFVALVADARSGLSRSDSEPLSPYIYYKEVERLNRWRLDDIKTYPDYPDYSPVGD